MNNKYTGEKNIQILISLLKKHNVKNIIASPGATNVSFVASVQNDSFFNVISCVDERSACYLACGMAAELNEPVVLTCTGATASRNYIPGLTEAFYRKLPIIAITATQYTGRIGHNVPQVIDRSILLNDIVVKSIQLDLIHTLEDAWSCNIKVNEAILATNDYGGGPVHINMVTDYSNDFPCTELPDERIIKRYFINDQFPDISSKKIAIFVGNHLKMSNELENSIDEFCEKYNAVVLCDHTSNYHGKYRILGNLICAQSGNDELKNTELLIDIGNINGSYMEIKPKNVWRVNPDGVIRDRYKKLTKIFAMEEIEFFNKYNVLGKKNNTDANYFKKWKSCYYSLNSKINMDKLPFSNIWIANQIINKFEENSTIHLAILNTLRSWNFFESTKKLNVYCNTGGFGIDGIVSSAIGASLVKDSNVYCIVGDLAFFYDLNSIGNRNIKNNLKIILINNGCGTEFHNYNHRAAKIASAGNLSSEYFAADGHYGNKSKELVKHYSQDLGFMYMSASNKEEFLCKVDKFVSDKNSSMIFEIFTNPEEESNALKMIKNLDTSLKGVAMGILGDKGVEIVKKVIKK